MPNYEDVRLGAPPKLTPKQQALMEAREKMSEDKRLAAKARKPEEIPQELLKPSKKH